jgi:hypothetical protein
MDLGRHRCAELFIRHLHFWMHFLDMLPALAEEFLVVGSFQVLPTGTIHRSTHGILL